MLTMDWTAAAKSNFLPFFRRSIQFDEFVQLPKGHFSFETQKKYSNLWSNIKGFGIKGQTKTERNFSKRSLLPPLLFAAIKKYHRIDLVSIEFLFFGGIKNKHIERDWTTEGAGTSNACEPKIESFHFDIARCASGRRPQLRMKRKHAACLKTK